MLRILSRIVMLLVLVGGVQLAHAVPTSFTFTGRLASDGVPFEGSVTLELALHDTASGGTPLWSETHGTVADDGLVAVAMGGEAALDQADFGGGDLWLAVTVNGTALAPRFQLRSVPFAMRSAVSDSTDRLGNLAPGDVALATHNHAGVYAPAAHAHPGVYLPVGPSLACPTGQKVTGLSAATGSVVCGADTDTQYGVVAAGGLAVASNLFSIASGGVTSARIAAGAITTDKLASTVYGGNGTATTVARSDHGHDGTYVRNYGGGADRIKVGTRAAASGTVSFPGTAFPATPVIVLTPEFNGGGVSCWVLTRTTTSFNYTCNGAVTNVHWMAVD